MITTEKPIQSYNQVTTQHELTREESTNHHPIFSKTADLLGSLLLSSPV